MEIRNITLDDVPPYRDLLSSVYRESQAYFVAQPGSLDGIFDRVRLTMLGQSAHLVAEFQGEILGWVDVTPYSIRGMDHCADLSMGVKSELRGRGIGSALLQEAFAWAKKSGLEWLHLEVFASNEAARRLYLRHGFRVDGVRQRARKCLFTGRYDSIVLMSRPV